MTTTKGTIGIKGRLDDVATDTVNEDELGDVRITAGRAMHSSLHNAAGTEVGTATDPVRIDPTGSTTQPVSVASMPLPTGAATSANQATEIISLSSIDTKLSSQATAANQATEIISLQILDDVPASMNASFNKGNTVMGQLDDIATTAATENNVAPVRITAQRALHGNLRNNAGTEIATATDPLRIDPTGSTTQPISVVSLPLPTGAATSANQATEIASLSSIDTKLSSQATAANQTTQITSLQLLDDVPAGMNAAFNKANPIAGQLDDTSTTAATEDNVAPVRITAQRALHTNLRNTAGTEIGTSSAPIRTDPTGSTIQPISVTDIAPATQNITAQDVGTSSLVGSNSQTFYFGTPTTNSAAQFAVASIENVIIEASLLGGGGTMVVEVSMDNGGFWLRPNVYQVATQSYTNSFATPFVATLNVAGMTHIRVRATSAWSGSATITVRETQNSRNVTIGDSLPAGANVVGGVTQSGTWNVNNISGTVSLPTGAATSANQATEIASLSSIDTKLSAQATAANQTTQVTSLQLLDDVPTAMNGAFSKGNPVMGQLDDTGTTVATEDNVAPVRITTQRALHTNLRNAAGTEIGTSTTPIEVAGSVNTTAAVQSTFSPDPSIYDTGVVAAIKADSAGNVMVRGQVLSDEGSVRDDFIGSSLTTALTGTLTFTNNSTAITGSGTSFTTELTTGQYIKKTADAGTAYVQIDSIKSDTALTLKSVYTGTTAASTAVKSNWTTNNTTGTVTVGSSLVNLLPSTASGNSSKLWRDADYLPFNLYFKAIISQRIANQTATIGMQDNPLSVGEQAVIVFDGTVNTTVKFRTASSSAAADIQETVVTLPNSLTTASANTYEIDLTGNQAALVINDIVVAVHKDHIPGPYSVLTMVADITNSAVVTATTFSLDYFYFANLDQIDISNDFKGEPLKAQLMGKQQTTGLPIDLNLDASGNLIVTSLTGFGANFSFGDVTTSATTLAVVRRTAYTEQAANAQRSIASASALDTAAGTGARTITITYYTATGTGPFTEVVTLNGVTFVNTVATNICYIEKIQVTAVGSTGSNAGILTLKAATAGGGATIGTVGATDKQTFWAHHYIPLGKTANITGISCSHNGTTVGSGGVFQLNAFPIGVTNAVDIQVSDFVRLYGQSSTFSRVYQSPIKITGPARLTLSVIPETASAAVYRSSIDFFEP